MTELAWPFVALVAVVLAYVAVTRRGNSQHAWKSERDALAASIADAARKHDELKRRVDDLERNDMTRALNASPRR